MIVVDASVATKWLLPEVGAEAARQLIDDGHKLVSPSLVRMEVTGALVRRFRQGKLPEPEVRGAFTDWESLLRDGVLSLEPAESLLEDALDLAISMRHPLPDCLYLAAARRYEAEFVTADRTLFERGSTVYGKISLLDGAAIH